MTIQLAHLGVFGRVDPRRGAGVAACGLIAFEGPAWDCSFPCSSLRLLRGVPDSESVISIISCSSCSGRKSGMRLRRKGREDEESGEDGISMMSDIGMSPVQDSSK